MPDLQIKGYSATFQYKSVPKVYIDTPKSTEDNPVLAPYTFGEAVSKNVQPDFSAGDMQVPIADGELVTELTVAKPAELVPENIPEGQYIAGVGPGTFQGGGGGDEIANAILDGTLSTLSVGATRVMPYAMMSRVSLVDVSLSNCTSIGSAAFRGCYNLQSVHAPQCTRIDDNVFSECAKLTDVSIPKCTYIGELAFGSLTITLKNVTIPDKLDFLGYNAFYSQGFLPSQVIGSFTLAHGCIVSASNISTVAGTLTLPTEATCIGLNYSPLGTANSITSVYGRNIKGLASNAFGGFNSLRTVNLPKCMYIDHSAFGFVYSTLTSLILPEVREIASHWIYARTRVTTVNYPKLTSLGYGCFNGWSMLSTVSLPLLSIIPSSAFGDCSKLTSVYIPNCTRLESQAFYMCRAISVLSMPKCVYIGPMALFSTPMLKSLSIPECTHIDDNAVQRTSNLTTVYAPKCSYLGQQAFGEGKMLASVTIPNCQFVGRQAFVDCPVLPSIDLPVCTYISDFAFTDDYALSIVSIPLCEHIGSSAFRACKVLPQISLPKCTYIGNQAFYSNLTALKSVYLLGDQFVTLGGPSVFYPGTTTTGQTTPTIYVRQSMLASYKKSQYWSLYASKIVGLTDAQISTLEAT